jgi:hypothetical protein
MGLSSMFWVGAPGASAFSSVIARSGATKQSSFPAAAKLDCFASLAMTGLKQRQIALAAMFTISASKAVLNTKEMMPCTVAVRRMILSVIPTSETCAVMPITKEK